MSFDTTFITPNKLVRKSIWLNSGSYADSEIVLEIIKIKGKRVVCSEISLFEFPLEGQKDIASGPMGSEADIRMPFNLERLYPNPAKAVIRMRFTSPDERKISIKLYDVCGRLAYQQEIMKSKVGMNEVLIGSEGLSAGVYFVQLEAGGYKKTEKAILLR